MSELQTCPFCGSIPVIHESIVTVKLFRDVRSSARFAIFCSCGISTSRYDDQEALISFWNKRTISKPTPSPQSWRLHRIER